MRRSNAARADGAAGRIILNGRRRFLAALAMALVAWPAPAGEPADAPKADGGELKGTWKLEAFEAFGERWGPGELTWTFDGEKVVTVAGQGFVPRGATERRGELKFKLDTGRSPKWIDLTPLDGEAKGRTSLAIYEVDGDRLRVRSYGALAAKADAESERKRPMSFEPDGNALTAVFKRAGK